MIYEIRVYEAAEGRADAMRRRFRDNVVTQFFPRHGIELVGAFTAPVEDGRLTYMTRFADEDARKKAWAVIRRRSGMGGGESRQRNRRAAVEEPDRLGAVAGDRRLAARLAVSHETRTLRICQAGVRSRRPARFWPATRRRG